MDRQEANARIDRAKLICVEAGWKPREFDRMIDCLYREDAVERAESAALRCSGEQDHA